MAMDGKSVVALNLWREPEILPVTYPSGLRRRSRPVVNPPVFTPRKDQALRARVETDLANIAANKPLVRSFFRAKSVLYAADR
jgi:hypothetical protein